MLLSNDLYELFTIVLPQNKMALYFTARGSSHYFQCIFNQSGWDNKAPEQQPKHIFGNWLTVK
jgi:hypothetical protein